MIKKKKKKTKRPNERTNLSVVGRSTMRSTNMQIECKLSAPRWGDEPLLSHPIHFRIRIPLKLIIVHTQHLILLTHTLKENNKLFLVHFIYSFVIRRVSSSYLVRRTVESFTKNEKHFRFVLINFSIVL